MGLCLRYFNAILMKNLTCHAKLEYLSQLIEHKVNCNSSEEATHMPNLKRFCGLEDPRGLKVRVVIDSGLREICREVLEDSISLLHRNWFSCLDGMGG